MKKSLITGTMSLALLATMAVPALAATPAIDADGGSGVADVPLTVAVPTFSVTVPSQLPISVDAAGVVTPATDAKIINNSHGAVKVTNMTIKGTTPWTTASYDTFDPATALVDSTALAMMINNDKTTGADAITFTAANFPRMTGKCDTATDELPITYSAKVPAQSKQITGTNVATVTFVVGWDLTV